MVRRRPAVPRFCIPPSARAVSASELVKVNWVKMRMFEIRDPDGNTLWFGQSYDKPHAAHANPMFQKALPRLPLSDLAAGIAHYRDVLGFRVNYEEVGIRLTQVTTTDCGLALTFPEVGWTIWS